MLGDSAGMGKSRVLAAFLLDAHLRGHGRKLLVTVNQELGAEALTEGFAPLGCVQGTAGYDPAWRMAVLPLSRFKAGQPISLEAGVLYASYAQLSRKGRLSQLLAWLGGGAKPPALVFDEAHRAKNLFPPKGKFGTPAMSKQGRAVKALQDAHLDALVVYRCAAQSAAPRLAARADARARSQQRARSLPHDCPRSPPRMPAAR